VEAEEGARHTHEPRGGADPWQEAVTGELLLIGVSEFVGPI
jgi:hypothetical protein